MTVPSGYEQDPLFPGSTVVRNTTTHAHLVDGSSARGNRDVTPNNANDLPDGLCRGIIIGVAGDVKVTGLDGEASVWPSLVAGVIHPIYATRIWATGTTATTIKAVY